MQNPREYQPEELFTGERIQALDHLLQASQERRPTPAKKLSRASFPVLALPRLGFANRLTGNRPALKHQSRGFRSAQMDFFLIFRNHPSFTAWLGTSFVAAGVAPDVTRMSSRRNRPECAMGAFL